MSRFLTVISALTTRHHASIMRAQPLDHDIPGTGGQLLARMIYAAAMLAVGWVALLPSDAQAQTATLTVINERNMQFGSFAVAGTGYKEVSSTGAVQSVGIQNIGGEGGRPATIRLRYDRGFDPPFNDRISPRFQLVFSQAPPVSNSVGLTAQLSRYQSDLPNASIISPGQIVEVVISNCTTRICEMTFQLGARLDASVGRDGQLVQFNISIDATLISEN